MSDRSPMIKSALKRFFNNLVLLGFRKTLLTSHDDFVPVHSSIARLKQDIAFYRFVMHLGFLKNKKIV
jgi:hypothetical protein